MGGGGSSNLIFSKNPAGVLLIRNWVGSKSSMDKIVSPAARLECMIFQENASWLKTRKGKKGEENKTSFYAVTSLPCFYIYISLHNPFNHAHSGPFSFLSSSSLPIPHPHAHGLTRTNVLPTLPKSLAPLKIQVQIPNPKPPSHPSKTRVDL